MPLSEALPIAKQIAEALEAAHEQGIRRFQGFRDLPRGREGLIERHPGPAEAGHYRFDNTRSGSVRL